ncbi:MAG TPA: macro domain-containing protein [Clostridia bacterium]
MKKNFVDINNEVIESLKNQFGEDKGINFICGDILKVARGAVVSPANSYGYMDGGIDEAYIRYFGLELEVAVRNRLSLIGGSLPVGSAFTIETGDERIPYMIFAPTMEMPGEVLPRNCYLAMRAILREIDRSNGRYDEVYCPGLCTGTGYVSPESAAEEMYRAFMNWINK